MQRGSFFAAESHDNGKQDSRSNSPSANRLGWDEFQRLHLDIVLYRLYVITIMKSVNALEVRQSLGRVLRALEKGGRPVLVLRGKTPAAVLISLRDFQERFADSDADEKRRDVVARIKALRFSRPPKGTTLELLRELREPGL